MIICTVNRIGEFDILSCEPGPQCGSSETRHYRYHVSIEGDSYNLDENGFVVDNLEIAKYFDDNYHKKAVKALSCEVMAAVAVHNFARMRNGLRRVKVTIWGSDKSFIEAEWKT